MGINIRPWLNAPGQSEGLNLNQGQVDLMQLLGSLGSSGGLSGGAASGSGTGGGAPSGAIGGGFGGYGGGGGGGGIIPTGGAGGAGGGGIGGSAPGSPGGVGAIPDILGMLGLGGGGGGGAGPATLPTAGGTATPMGLPPGATAPAASPPITGLPSNTAGPGGYFPQGSAAAAASAQGTPTTTVNPKPKPAWFEAMFGQQAGGPGQPVNPGVQTSGGMLNNMMSGPMGQIGLGILSENTKEFGGDPYGAAIQGMQRAQQNQILMESVNQRRRDQAYSDEQRDIKDTAREGISKVLQSPESKILPRSTLDALGELAKLDPTEAMKQYTDLLKATRLYQQENQPGKQNSTFYTADSWQEYLDTGYDKNGIWHNDKSDSTVLVARDKGLDDAIREYGNIAVEAETDAGQMFQVADAYAQFAASADGQGLMAAGAGAWINENFKRLFGKEDALSHMRAEYTRLKNKLVVGDLPPGIASDRDVALIMEGYFDDKAHPAVIAAQMRGLAKLKMLEAARNSFRADLASRQMHERDFAMRWKERAPGEVLGIQNRYGYSRVNPGEDIAAAVIADWEKRNNVQTHTIGGDATAPEDMTMQERMNAATRASTGGGGGTSVQIVQ